MSKTDADSRGDSVRAHADELRCSNAKLLALCASAGPPRLLCRLSSDGTHSDEYEIVPHDEWWIVFAVLSPQEELFQRTCLLIGCCLYGPTWLPLRFDVVPPRQNVGISLDIRHPKVTRDDKLAVGTVELWGWALPCTEVEKIFSIALYLRGHEASR